MPLITLLSDYGAIDHYQAALKARILRSNPQARIVDISHNIQAFNIIHAAQVLGSVFKEFPDQSIHLVDVYAHGQGANNPIALKMDGHFFIGPNNGLFSLLGSGNVELIVELPPSNEGRKSFQAKNIMTSAAVALSQGKELSSIGVPCKNYVKLRPLQVRLEEKALQGSVIHVDRYGNAITNIKRKDIDKMGDHAREVLVEFGRQSLNKISKRYSDVTEGEIVCFFNDNDVLEIAVCEGNASKLLGLDYESRVFISVS